MRGDTIENESQVSPWHSRVALATGGTSVLLGVVVLVGWYTHSLALIQVAPAFVPMQYNTALGFLLCGAGLLSVALRRTGLATVFGAAAGTIGLLTLIEYIFGLNLGIDQLLMEHYIMVETSHPGRMAPNTALCFVLIGTALLVWGRFAPFRSRPLLLGCLGTLTLVLGVVAFVGYLSGASTAYGWGHLTRMVVHTAAGFVVLGTGILAVAYREEALARSESADIPTRPRRRVFILSTLIMTVVTFTLALNVVRELHHAAVEQKRADLLTLVLSWAETMVVSGRLDATPSQQDEPGTDEAATLARVTAALERLSGVGDNSELVLARREGGQIFFLLSDQQELDREWPMAVPFDSDRAEPMRRALLGQSGTLVGLDHTGEVVLAAYTPFGQYGWGLVGKVDMAEVGAPFVAASLLAGGVGLAIVALGALAFLFVVDPMIRGLAERTVELHQEIVEHKRAERKLHRYRLHLEEMVDQRTAELQIANQDLEDFAYSVSHDLKAPLRAITGFSEIISRRHRDSLNEEGRRYFDHIVAGGDHMNRLIEDILRYSRLGRHAVQVRPVPLADVFSALADTFQDRLKEVGGRLEIPDDPPTVRADPTLLSQIFTNLVDNGLSYHRPDVAPRVEIRWRTEGDRVIVSVGDDGIGIPAEFQEKAFNIFQRLHSDTAIPGTGIGLAIVKKAAAMIGGRVRLESAEGEGCTFHVDLPLGKEEQDYDETSPDPTG